MKQISFVLFFCLISLTAWSAETEKSTSEETKVMVVEARRPLHNEAFYKRLLEAFCQKHFDERFAFKKVFGKGAVMYYKNSLRVESVASRDTRTDIIRGKITYDYAYGAKTCEDGDFTAFVKSGTESDEFIIVFERNGGLISGNVKSTGEVSFIYP